LRAWCGRQFRDRRRYSYSSYSNILDGNNEQQHPIALAALEEFLHNAANVTTTPDQFEQELKRIHNKDVLRPHAAPQSQPQPASAPQPPLAHAPNAAPQQPPAQLTLIANLGAQHAERLQTHAWTLFISCLQLCWIGDGVILKGFESLTEKSDRFPKLLFCKKHNHHRSSDATAPTWINVFGLVSKQ
jgi:hypothetical protein